MRAAARRAVATTAAAAALLLGVGADAAEPLYAVRGHARMEVVLDDAAGLIGVDGDGYVWEIWGATSRSVRCRPLDAPPETDWARLELLSNGASFVPGGVAGNGRFAVALAEDGHGVSLFGIRRPEDSAAVLSLDRATFVQLGRADCPALMAAATPNVGWTDLGQFKALPDAPLPVLNRVASDTAPQYELVPYGGRLCLNTREGLRCAVPEGAALGWEDALPHTRLTTELTIDPAAMADLGTLPFPEPPTPGWRLRAFTRDPDGALWFIAELRWIAPNPSPTGSVPTTVTDWLPYLVALEPDGALLERTVPTPRGRLFDGAKPAQTLSEATSLAYEPALDAIVGFPILGTTTTRPDHGVHGGLEALVIPRDGDVPALLGLTDAAARAGRCWPAPSRSGQGVVCDEPNNFTGAVALPGGLGLVIRRGDLAFPERTDLLRLTFDPSDLDLDHDGLTAAEEALAGSSDHQQQSDLRAPGDGFEVHVAGTDPTDALDDPKRGDGFLRYAQSGLVARVAPAGVDFRQRVVRGGSPDGPLCVDSGWCPPDGGACREDVGYCVLADRRAVVPFPGGRDAVQKNEDGSGLTRRDEAGVWRVDVRTGEDRLALSASDLGLLGEGAAATLNEDLRVVATADALWVAYLSRGAEPNFRVAVKRGDRPLEVVYDHEATRCASHLGPCDPDAFEPPTTSFDDWLDPDDLRMSEVRVAGYLRELARLVIVVASRHHRYVVGLHATEPPAVLHYGGGFDSGPGTDLLPNYLQATGHDDYVWMGHTVVVTQTPGGPDDTTLVQGGAYRAWSGYAQLADLGGFARTYLRPPVAFWGDVLVIPDGDTGAPWELVRYDDFAQPGDVLFLGYVSVSLDYFRGNYMLFQSGPRGGLAPTWREERGGTDIWGLDVDADGDACVAERVPGDVVFLAAAPNALFTPSVQVDAWALPGVVDCRLTGDGGALALTADPPGLWRFADAHTAPEQVEALAGAPLTFVTERDGSLGVLSEEDGLRGRLVLRDGREVTIAAGSWGVQVDGREVARLDDMLGSAAANEGWARLVERPDGLVVVAPYGVRLPPGQGHLASPRVVDVDTGAVYRLTDRAFRVDLGAPVAVIPGGHGGDPWAPSLASGRPGATTWPDGPDAPGVPTSPTGGAPIGASPGGGADDGGGCVGAGAGGAEAALAALVAWVAVTRRRRRA